MKQFNRRVFVLTYSPEDLPTFDNVEEMNQFHQAIGRLVTYGMRQEDGEDALEFVKAGLTTNPSEVCCSYYPPILETEHRDELGYPVYYKGDGAKLDAAIEPLLSKSRDIHRPFVMAAVKHSDGNWGFHS